MRAGRFGYRVGAGASGRALLPATRAFIDRMAVKPTAKRRRLIDKLMRSVQASGAADQMDALHVIAAHDAQAARLNWLSDQYDLTAVNSPTFVVDRGYKGNGTSSYLLSPANPRTLHNNAAAKLKRDGAHMALWRLTSGYTAVKGLMGCREGASLFFDIVQFGATAFAARPNSGPERGLITVPATPGLLTMSREGATSAAYYWNGAPLTTLAEASVMPPNTTMAILAQNVTGEGPSAFAPDQIAFASFGGALTATQAAGLYAAIRAYLLAIGATS